MALLPHQRVMEQILPKVPGIVSYVDDILITGKDDEEQPSQTRVSTEKLQEKWTYDQDEQMPLLSAFSTVIG